LFLGNQPRSGSFSFGGAAAAVSYQDIENVSAMPLPSAYNLVLDMALAGYQNGVADTIAASLDRVPVSSFSWSMAPTKSSAQPQHDQLANGHRLDRQRQAAVTRRLACRSSPASAGHE